jgi:hypothetical protein
VAEILSSWKLTGKRKWRRLDGGDHRRRFDGGLRRRGTVDGRKHATVITVEIFGGSPASRFGGNRRMEAAVVDELRRAIPTFVGLC